jgi:ABC-type glycerol-3-phosphate transport system permease component
MEGVRSFDFAAIARRDKAAQRGSLLILAIAGLVSLVWLVPFYYLAVSIFKSTVEYAHSPPLSLPVSLSPIVDNVIIAWTEAKLGWGLLNSAIYGLTGAGIAVLVASLAAYGLTRIDFSGKTFWFLLIFSGTVFPLQMYLIPLFFMYQRIGLLNTRFGMILFYTAICIPFAVLVLKNFMSQLSPEMDEAARMDGATELRVYWSIVMPNCTGALLSVFLLQFTWIWNDLLFSTVLGNSQEIRSVMNALQVFHGNYSNAGPNIVLTGSVVASLPAFVLFLLTRRHFMAGLSVSSR